MGRHLILLASLLVALSVPSVHLYSQKTDKMQGTSEKPKSLNGESRQMKLFRDGNYAMFIHWGLYSTLGDFWKGKTYYGIAEWIMNGNMAGIPRNEYKALAAHFNPTQFDAHAIAQLAKDAGMKYIIITSKHHEGFAMYDSKACDFNIVKKTPFGRDPMKELSKACHDLGLGFGFYYSHNQDWTYPGGSGGPQTDAAGNKKTFDDYFYEKCLPQVEEITKNYGDIELVWFDTPGDIPQKYAKKLVDVVHHNQPNALVSGRVGYDMGDYQTLGDMEVPIENIEGLWESIDVTNDTWGYAWYDNNWKTPKQILSSLISTVGRGGTFMMNVGPDGSGRIPEAAQLSLRAAGKWIATYPQVIYGAGASPWKHALPWGDVTTNKGKLYLSVYAWPVSGKLYVPGITRDIQKVCLLKGKQVLPMKFLRKGSWLEISTPMSAPNPLVSVIEVTPARQESTISVDTCQAVDPELGADLSAKFAAATNGKSYKKSWMEKYGEFKIAYVVDNWNTTTSATWTVDIKDPGMYQISLKYASGSRLVWKVENDENSFIQNQQGISNNYEVRPIGWMKFNKAGKHTLTVRLLDGDGSKASLASLIVKPVEF